ncbi:MAG: hypothetical protein WBG37_06165, partial [Desulfobacterales bacterium]
MERLDRDFFLPFRVVMGTQGVGALSDLLDRYAPGSAVIIGDEPVFDNGGVAALAQDLKSKTLSPKLTLKAPRPPLTPEAAAQGAAQLRSLKPGITIALGGAGAMEYAALAS